MKIKILLGMLFSLTMMTIYGCGGGGGGAGPTVVSGTAAKGPFIAGSVVKVFAIDAATRLKGAQVGAGQVSDATGAYSVDISPYVGPILIEVSGSYKDEATVANITVGEATPLRAAIASASGNTTVMVSPLTELAVREMGTVMSEAAINTKNTEIATAFKVGNIISTKPTDATVAPPATATAAEKDLGLVLAAISQLVSSSGKSLSEILNEMSADINGTAMAERSTVGFKSALFDFIQSANNKTTVTAPPASINPTSIQIARLAISRAAGGTIGGIDFTVTLPGDVTVAVDTTATSTLKPTADGAVVASGVAATGTSISVATFNATQLRVVMANASGFGAGQFVTVNCTLPPTSTVTALNLQTALGAATGTVTDTAGVISAVPALTAAVVIF
jgi:hypothetical protein